MSEIISFKPFLAHFISYSGDCSISVRFTCLHCGSHNVKRRKDLHFFQGHFECDDCYNSLAEDGFPYNYASSCFILTREPMATQLTLF